MSNTSSFKPQSQRVLIFGIVLITGLVLAGANKDALLARFTPPAETPVTYVLPQPRVYQDAVSLPKPRLRGSLSLEQAIQERRSQREFTEQAVSLSELSQMLWSAQGITDEETGHRAAPSAKGAYPMTMFVVVRNVTGLEPGLYEYLPKTHQLGDLKLADAGTLLNGSGVQAGAQNSPVVFVLTAAYGRAEEILGASAKSSSLLEAGHIGQNMYLQAEGLNMGMVVMGGFDPAKVGAAIKLDVAESIVYIMPFGHPAPEKVLGAATEETKVFTLEELGTFDGQEGRKAYFAYEGKVYDITGSDEWKDGKHYGLMAGKDLTGQEGDAPHGNEVLDGLKVVGTFGEPVAAKIEAAEPRNMQNYYILGGGAIAVLAVAFLARARK